ncbi:MAG: hypothetical protein ACXV8O_07300 [Methylobacter sp.]
MSEARTKLDIIYNSVLGDIDTIIARIEALNASSTSITTAIEKFNCLESRTDKKLDEINTFTKVFNKNTTIALACTFIVTSCIGAGVGYYQLAERLQSVVFEDHLKKVTDARLKFEAEQQAMMLAKRKGIVFYSNGIALPIKNPNELRVTAGDKLISEDRLFYLYPE